MRLRLRVAPKDGEDVVGLAMRLALRGGHPNLISFLRAHRILLDTASFEDGSSRLAGSAGLPIDPLLAWSLRPVTPSVMMFRNQHLPHQSGLLSKCRRFCPLCFQDDFKHARSDEPEASIPFIRSWWRTTFIYACPIHNVAMLDNCPACGQRIFVDLLPLHQCSCGHDLRSCASQKLTSGDLIANNYFLGRLSMAEIIPCPMLDRISIVEAANVLRRLGAAALLGKREDIKIAVGQLDKDLACDQAPAAFGKLINTGFEYARDGSTSLLKLLNKMVEPKLRPYAGPAEIVGDKFRSWAVHRDNPIRETLIKIWNPFVLEHCSSTRRIAVQNGVRPSHLAAVPQLLHPLERERFARVLGYALPDSVSRKEAYAIGRKQKLMITQKELFARTVWNSRAGMDFGNSASIAPVWHSDVPHAKPFYLHEVAAFFDKLAAISTKATANNQQLTPISAVFSRNPMFAPILLSRIFREDIPLFDLGAGPLLSSYCVPSDAAPERETLHVSGIHAAYCLGVSVDTVYELAARSYLNEIKNNDGRAIEITSFDAFNKCHVTPARLGEICYSGMQTDAIENLLLEAGVSGILPTQYQMIFSRECAIRAFYENWDWNLEPPTVEFNGSLVRRVS